jgi:glycerophosphoryl diester phosphodiesterase
LEAFHLARRLGAPGLESDVWRSADGLAVLDHDGVIGLRRRGIDQVDRTDLPEHIPTLDELYEACGTGYELSLDLKDPAAAEEVLAVAHRHGAAERLWLCHPDREVLSEIRGADQQVRLVHSTLRGKVDGSDERWAADLADRQIDTVNLHHSEWTAGGVALFHRFGVLCFGWDAQHERVLKKVLACGVDGVFSDHVDRMVDALAAAG